MCENIFRTSYFVQKRSGESYRQYDFYGWRTTKAHADKENGVLDPSEQHFGIKQKCHNNHLNSVPFQINKRME